MTPNKTPDLMSEEVRESIADRYASEIQRLLRGKPMNHGEIYARLSPGLPQSELAHLGLSVGISFGLEKMEREIQRSYEGWYR